jgi:hypothetical protein
MKNLSRVGGIILAVVGIVFAQSTGVVGQSDCGFMAAAWQPTGDQIAFNCNDTVYVYTSQMQLVTTLVGPLEPADTFPGVTALAWSPNGLYLAAAIVRIDGEGNASHLVVWEVSSGNRILDIAGRDGPIAWSPDSRLIAADSIYPEGMFFYDRATGDEISHCLECGYPLYASWNPTDIHQFLASHPGQNTVFFDPLASNPSPDIDQEFSVVGGGYSPDGSRLLVSDTTTYQLKIIDAYTRQNVAVAPFDAMRSLDDYYWLENGIYINSEHATFRWDGVSTQLTTLPISDTPSFWKSDGTAYINVNNTGVFIRDTETGILKAQLLFDVPSVYSATLFNTSTGQPIAGFAPLTEGATIDLNALGMSSFNIRANVNANRVRSVFFYLDEGVYSQTDDTAPYELTNWSPTPGRHTLWVTPYPEAGRTGNSGGTYTIHFTIISSTESAPKGE